MTANGTPSQRDPTVLSLLRHIGHSDVPYTLVDRGLSHLTGVDRAQYGVYLTARHTDLADASSCTLTDETLTVIVQVGGRLPPDTLRLLQHLTQVTEVEHLTPPDPHLPRNVTELIVAPVVTGQRTTGLLALLETRPGARMPAASASLLAVLAQQIGKANETQVALHNLNRTREQTFRVLGRVLEYRSHETKGHTDRVTNLALKLGLKLDLTFEQLTHLRWGAYLHDIGKIAISDAVLHKEGPLNSPERRSMHQHVIIGETILREQGLVPQPVLDIVRSHHERWDGHGYPDGLRGPDIPLLARIFAVVDVYDALSSERPYKPSWSALDTSQELWRMAGTHLDPHLVEVFQHLIEPATPGQGLNLFSPEVPYLTPLHDLPPD